MSVTSANIGAQNFVGRSGWRLHGRVLTSTGAGVPGVTVMRSGSAIPATTNGAGYYNFYNVRDGSVTLTPTKSGTIFTPASKTLLVNGADVLNQNFIAATGYTVSGRIADSTGAALPGIEVALTVGHAFAPTGPRVLVHTNSAGYYTFTNVANGDYRVTPTPLSGDNSTPNFAPQFLQITVADGNLGNQNFIGLDE